MTTEIEALRRVAEAARVVRRLAQARYPTEAEHKLDKALRGLGAPPECVSAAPTGCTSDSECAATGQCLERALPAAPQPETRAVEVVTLGLMLSKQRGDYMACDDPGQEDPRFWAHVGSIEFTPPPKPTLPTVIGTVRLQVETE